MKKYIPLFILVCTLLSCKNEQTVTPPEESVPHGNIGDVVNIDGFYYKITNNVKPYSVELVRNEKTSNASKRSNKLQMAENNRYTGNVIIPSQVVYDGETFSVTSIGESAFYRQDIRSVFIPGSVDSIGFNAFRLCESMEKITLSEGLKKIGRYAFGSCKKFTSLSIPNSVVEIDDFAFEECYYWTYLVIGTGLKKLGFAAFDRRVYPTAISAVYCYAVEPPEIQELGNSCYAFVVRDCVLYVPKGSGNSYKKAPGWQHFYTIYEMK